ncbi:UNVERIFIED_CONTAM: hypothetical protein FKN15_020939 [Acipenser sinensis]
MFQTPCAAGEELRTLRSVRNFLEKSNEHLCVVCAVNTILRTLRTVTKYRVRKLLRWRRIIRSLCQENQAMRAPRYRSTGEDATQSAYPDRVVNTHTWSAQSVYLGGTEAKAAVGEVFVKQKIQFTRRKKRRERAHRTHMNRHTAAVRFGRRLRSDGDTIVPSPEEGRAAGSLDSGDMAGLAPRRILV